MVDFCKKTFQILKDWWHELDLDDDTVMRIRFLRAMQKHNLWDKATLHSFEGKITLYRLIEENEVSSPLPYGFIEDVKKIVKQCAHPKSYFEVSTKGITKAEIAEEQQAWNRHCDMFWAVYD
jgi:hypothetical protein